MAGAIAPKKRLTDLTQLEEAGDRQRYILNKLLFEDPVQSPECLQRELFIGKTTLHSILADIRKLFIPYQLELLVTRKGIELKGMNLLSVTLLWITF